MYRRLVTLSLRASRPLFARSIVTSPFPDVPLHRGDLATFTLANAHRFGDRVAIQDGVTGNSVRYSELKDLTSSVASALTKRGFQKGQTVTIFADNALESVVAYHGIVAAGGIVNLVNCNFTAHELTRAISITRPHFMLITSNKADVAMKAAAAVGCVEHIFVIGERVSGCHMVSEWLEDDGSASPWGQLDISHDDTAVCPMSSGTSGLPKVVQLTHGSITANLCQGDALLDYNSDDTILVLLPFYHIYSPVIVYGFGLRAGAKHVVLPKFDPKQMLQSVERYKVTFLPLVPPLILFLMQSHLVDQFDLKSITRVLCGAAPLLPETHSDFVAKFRQHQPEFDLRQGYGMTELSPLSHISPKRSLRPGEKEGTVGVLFPNTECRVLKPGTEEELGPNQEGEIVIRGPQTMKGYLGDAGATGALIKNGWVYTGDLGHYDDDGYFYVTDRLKDLIKFKGIPVAPAEVEAFLLTHPAVEDCCVIGRKDARAGEVPLAFVVSKAQVTEQELMDFAAEHLSNEKHLRGGVRFVTEIPKSPSGKILRRLLRDQLG